MRTTPRRSRAERPDGASRFPAPTAGRRGLVCAGGGVSGAMYQIGVLAALEERLENSSIADAEVVVGVSAGAYVGSLLANGISPGLLYRSVTRTGPSQYDIDDLNLFRLNLGEVARRLATAPLTVLDALRDFYENRRETTLTDLVQVVGHLLPSGLFTTDGLGDWVASFLSQGGRTNDFRKLARRLLVVAVEIDTGETHTFGFPGSDEVPISRAVEASCAIPGVYRPVRIGGVDYVDGGVRKTAHISLALEQRCGLVVCVNPIVPIRYASPKRLLPIGRSDQGALASLGLPSILDQVFRVTLHSRMQYGLGRYRKEAPGADVVVVEPRAEDLPRYMTQGIMRTSGRARIAEFAYRSTMRSLDADFPRLARLFGRHGMTLRPASPVRFSARGASAARSERPDSGHTARIQVLEARDGATASALGRPPLRLVR